MKYWCIKDRNGGLILFTMSTTRKRAVDDFVGRGAAPRPSWDDLHKRGYRAVRVEVREVENG